MSASVFLQVNLREPPIRRQAGDEAVGTGHLEMIQVLIAGHSDYCHSSGVKATLGLRFLTGLLTEEPTLSAEGKRQPLSIRPSLICTDVKLRSRHLQEAPTVNSD